MTDVACTSPVILRNRSEDSWGWIVNNSSSAPKQQFLLGENHCPSLTKGWEEKSSISCVKRNVFLWQQLWNWNSAASQPSKWWSSQLLKILDHCCAKNKELVKNDVFLQDLFVFKKIMKERIETLKEDQFQNEFQKNLNRFRSWQVEIGILRQMKPCGQVETSTASIYQISQRKCIKCRIKVVATLFPIHPFLLHPKNALFGNPKY